jgi:hypothetical protein
VNRRNWLATVTLAVLLGSLSGGGTAAASTWTATTLNAGEIGAHLYGMSCPSPSLCVAVGGNGTIASSTAPLSGADAWSVVRPGGSFEPGPGVPAGSSFGGAQLKDVDCPSAGLCVAASFDGKVYSSTDPSGGVGAWKVTELTPPKTPRVHALGISCPSANLCVAAAYGGKIAYSRNPTGEMADWHLVSLAQPFDFRGISCPSASLCVAVDLTGDVVTSTDPTGDAGAWVSAGAPAGPERLTAVDCPTTSLCVTGNSTQILTSTNPTGGASAWRAVNAGTGIPITGISCPTASACAAVDQNADVLVSTNPVGGPGAWSFKNVIPFNLGREEGAVDGNGMFGLSCASIYLCAGAGSNYQVIVSGDPFAPDRLVAAKPGSARRPRVVITKHPPKRIDPRKGGVRVIFRFHAIGKATGFRCKTDRQKHFRPCRSPLQYRAGSGEHTFKVRAIAPNNLRGPTTAFHFRIGKILEPAPAGSCSNPNGGRGCVNARG